MNEKISWHESLVKKYSSSNHFKLLSQLRNEVTKYPLNKKKNLHTGQTKDNKVESKNNILKSISHDKILINDTNINKEQNQNKLTVSFNNSKNFSIYKNISNDNNETENNIVDDTQSNDTESSSSFKDRLNQVDMK